MTFVRRSARVVLFDAGGAVLLVKSGFRRSIGGVTSAWFVPGGGVERDETVRLALAAAARELKEETGVSAVPDELVHLAFAEGDGQVDDLRGRMRDDIYVSQTLSRAISTSGLEQHERDALHGYRWWLIEDLLVTDELVFPRGLGAALTDYRASSNWSQPVQLPW